MKPLQRSLPHAARAPLDSQHFVSASTAVVTEEWLGEPQGTPVNKRHVLHPCAGPFAACVSTPKGGPEHAGCRDAIDGGSEEVDDAGEADQADIRESRSTCADSNACTNGRKGSRMARCKAARNAAPTVSRFTSATVDAAGADVTPVSLPSANDSKSGLTLKAPANADEPNTAALAQREQEQNGRLLKDASISALTGEASSAFSPASHQQDNTTEQVTRPNSASAGSASSGRSAPLSGSTGDECKKPPFLKEGKDLTIPCVTLLQGQVADVGTHTSPQGIQLSTKGGSGCMPCTPATKSKSGDQEDSDRTEKLQRRGSGQDVTVCEAAALTAAAWTSRVGRRHTVLPQQARRQGILTPHTEDSTSYTSSETQNSAAQQQSHPVPSAGTTGVHQSSVHLHQQFPVEVQQESRNHLGQLTYARYDAIIQPSRPLLADSACPGSFFHPQHSRVSDTSHHPTNWQTTSAETAQQKNFSVFIADGCEASGRDPVQLAGATLTAGGTLSSLPCWPPSTWPSCSSLGIPPAGLPPHSLQQLQQHLEKHLLPGWSPTLTLPNFYFTSEHNGTDAAHCSNVYDTGRPSTAATWGEAEEARGSYLPGGLWQPAPSPSVKEDVQASLQMEELLSFGHVIAQGNNASSSSAGCGAPPWICRMHSEQPFLTPLASSQVGACWLQQAQHESAQGHGTQHFEQYEVSDSASRCAAAAALMSSPQTLEAKGSETQTDWGKRAAQVESRAEKLDSTRGGTSSVYRRQLLQQLALRHNQHTQQVKDVSSIGHEKEDPSESREPEGAPVEEHAVTSTYQGCTREGPEVHGDRDGSASASPDKAFFTGGYDAIAARVAAPSDTSIPLIAAAQRQRGESEDDIVNRNLQLDYDCINTTQAPKNEGSQNRCTSTGDANQFVSADQATDLCSLRQQMQWVVPPPEAAAALAAARAAAASAAAAIAAEWQQHLEQHYLEDWMQQLSPAHQWWLLHLQQTDFSTRSTPFYMKDWQEIDVAPSVAVCAALDAEARSNAASTALQANHLQQQLLQNAGSEEKWTTGFSAEQPWELQSCTLEQLEPPASPPWPAFSHAPVTPPAAVTREGEGPSWQYLSETGFQREQQTTRDLRSSSRQQIPEVHRCARTDRTYQRCNTLGEVTQQRRWDGACPMGTPFSAATDPPNERAAPFVPQHPRQQRQLQRIARRSAACQSLQGHSGGLLHATSGQIQRSAPKCMGRRWRRGYRGHLAEDCYKDVLLSTKPDVSCPRRSSCCVPRCVDTVSSCPCNRCTLQEVGAGAARRTGGDCIASSELACPSEVGEPCRSRSLCRRRGDFRKNALRCEREAADLGVKSHLRRRGRRGSAVEQRSFWSQNSPKRLTTRSCCPPDTRSPTEESAKKREDSQEGVTQGEGTGATALDVSCAQDDGQTLQRRGVLHSREFSNYRELSRMRQGDRVAEEVANGKRLRNKERLSRGCNNYKTATDLMAGLGDKSLTDGTNRLGVARQSLNCSCGESCVQTRARKDIRNVAASPRSLSRRCRQSEKLRAAGQTVPLWLNSEKCWACQAGRRRESSTGTVCSSKEGNGDEDCSRNNDGGFYGEACRREEEMQTVFAAEETRARRKSPVPSSREGPVERGRYFAASRGSHPNIGSFLKETHQDGTDEIVASPAGQGRRCRQVATPPFEGAKGHRLGLGRVSGSPPGAMSPSSSSCGAAPIYIGTSYQSRACPKRDAAVVACSDTSLKGAQTTDICSREKAPDGKSATGKTDNRCGNTTTMKTRSWLAVVREAAAKPTVHVSPTKTTTPPVQQLLRQEAVLPRRQLRKPVQESTSIRQRGPLKTSACSTTKRTGA